MNTIIHMTAQRTRGLLIVLLASALLLGTLPTPAAAQDGSSLPASYRMDGITHQYQTWNNCGGANLTMAMSYYGWGYDQDVAQAWLKPNIEDKNVSPTQMAAFVNEGQSDLPNVGALWRYGGTLELVKALLSSGFPVIVESGYDVEDLGWMGHYETVVAYDDSLQTIWVYDSYLGIGEGFGMSHSYAEFDNWWRHFNRTFIVLFDLDRADELRAILGDYVQPDVAAQRALNAARDEAQRLNDGWAWFNMGTSLAKLGNFYDAATAFDQAFQREMPYRTTWYRHYPFEAYYRVGRYDDVITLVDSTEATTVYVEELYYWRGMVHAARGQFAEAVDAFDDALALNRNFTAAQVAKQQVQAGTFSPPGA